MFGEAGSSEVDLRVLIDYCDRLRSKCAAMAPAQEMPAAAATKAVVARDIGGDAASGH